MKKLKLTEPTLLIMGRTGRLGNSETNQNKDAPNMDEVRQQVEILLRSHDMQNSISQLLEVKKDGSFTYETTLQTTRETHRFKAFWKIEGKTVTLDFLNQINLYKMKNEDDEFEVNEDDDEMDGMYPVGLKMREDNNDDDNDRNILEDDDNNDPLDREEGMFPLGVK